MKAQLDAWGFFRGIYDRNDDSVFRVVSMNDTAVTLRLYSNGKAKPVTVWLPVHNREVQVMAEVEI